MPVNALLRPVLNDPAWRARFKKALNSVGFDTTDWVRVVMYDRCFEFIRSLKPSDLDVLEIAAGPQWRREFEFKSYTPTEYPPFDICEARLPETFDLIIADQVFEHLKWPYRAAKNVNAMLRPGGWFVITTPFLIKIHHSPVDCSRWTQEGLSNLLQEGGFAPDRIRTDAWGNRACVKANFMKWPRYGWHRSLVNEPDFPVMVWAFAQKEGP